MPNPVRDNARAARVLAEWARDAFATSALPAIAARHNVGERTVWRWKTKLDKDPDLAAAFRERLNALLDSDWTTHLDAAISESIARIRALIQNADDLDAATRAFAALTEVAITKEVLRGALDASEGRSYAPSSGADRVDRPVGPN